MKKKYKEKSNVCVVNNVHGLLLYILQYPAKLNDTIYVIGDELDKVINLSINTKIVINTPKKVDSNLAKIIKYFKYYYITQPILRNKFKGMLFFGQDHHFFSNVMDKHATVIEDGERTYFEHPGKATRLHKLLFPIRFESFHGREIFTKKVLLTNDKNIPKALKNKYEYIDLKSKWKQLSEIEKEIILSIFKVDEAILTDYRFSTSIIFTQPFSEEGFMSELEKVNMYKKLLEKYSVKNIIIKPHPRETTKYDFEELSFFQLPSHFPSQFLSFFDFHFEKAITVNSTAIYGISADEIIVEGVCEPKLLSKLLGSFTLSDLSKDNKASK